MPKNKIFYYTRRYSQKIGKRQGRNFTWKIWPFWKNPKVAYPLVDQVEPAQFEDELLGVAINEIAEVNEFWKSKDKQLKTRFCTAKAEREIALLKFKQEESDVAPEEANVEEVSEELMNFESAPIKHRTAIFFHFIVFICEVIFNSIVFNVFGSEIWESIITAVGVSLALTVFAYFLGKLMKKGEKTTTDIIWIYLIPLVTMGGIIAVAVIRSIYIGELMENPDTEFGIHMSVNLAAFLFALLNIVLFLGGVLISYMSFTHNERLLETIKKQYAHAIARLKKETREVAIASAEFEQANNNYIRAKHERQKEFERHNANAKTIKAIAEYLVETYRTANMEARRDSIKPLCFKKQPDQIILPPELLPQNLDWDCKFSDKYISNNNTGGKPS